MPSEANACCRRHSYAPPQIAAECPTVESGRGHIWVRWWSHGSRGLSTASSRPETRSPLIPRYYICCKIIEIIHYSELLGTPPPPTRPCPVWCLVAVAAQSGTCARAHPNSHRTAQTIGRRRPPLPRNVLTHTYIYLRSSARDMLAHSLASSSLLVLKVLFKYMYICYIALAFKHMIY